MVSASVVWTAVKVVAALAALLIGAVCVVVCYQDERAKELEKDGVCPHFDTGDCVAVEPRTGMPIICPCSSLCSNCNAATAKARADWLYSIANKKDEIKANGGGR